MMKRADTPKRLNLLPKTLKTPKQSCFFFFVVVAICMQKRVDMGIYEITTKSPAETIPSFCHHFPPSSTHLPNNKTRGKQ
jgi:hypothetical protein